MNDAAGTETPVTRFGLGPGSCLDAGAAVSDAVAWLRASQGAVLVFPPGDYRFGVEGASRHELYLSNTDCVNPRNVAVYLEGLKDARIVGKGARLLFAGRIIPFVLRRCAGVELSGFEIDWPRPLMSQGEVIESGRDGFTLKIDGFEFPYVVEEERLQFLVEGERKPPWAYMELDPRSRGVAYGTGDAGCIRGAWDRHRVTELSPGVVRFRMSLERWPKVGSYLVARHGARDHAGTFIEDSSDIRLTDMEYRHSSGLGVLAQFSENLTYRNVHFRPAPGSSRLFSGHDDGFHFSNCKGRIVVEGCSFYGLQDDPINVHGTSIRIEEKIGDRTLRCRFMHGQSVGMRLADEGDTISFLDHETLLSMGRGEAAAVRHVSLDALEIELREPFPSTVAVGDALESLSWTPEVLIRKCTFGGVRARGLLLSTPGKSVVEECLFRSSGTAILIPGDANGWYESGAVTDVLIRGNRFEDCLTSPYQFCNAVISIAPEIPRPGGGAFHRNIRVEGNTFVTFDRPVLWALSTAGLRFAGNTIAASRSYPPWHPNPYGLTFLHCEDVEVRDNGLDPAFAGREVRIEGGRPESIRVEGW